MAKKTSKRGKGKGTSGDSSSSTGVRDVIRGCPWRVVGEIAWVKGGEPVNVPWESRPERDAAKIMAADARIHRIKHQPFVVHYALNGVLHKYIPDYKVNGISTPVILEIKEFAEATNDENQARFPEIARVLASEGFDFRVWTENEFRKQPLLSNSNYVLRFRNYPFEGRLACDVACLLAAHPCLSASAIRAQLGPAATTDALFAIVCFGHIYVDCNQTFGADPTFSEVPRSG